jgi:hypothetical protein
MPQASPAQIDLRRLTADFTFELGEAGFPNPPLPIPANPLVP